MHCISVCEGVLQVFNDIAGIIRRIIGSSIKITSIFKSLFSSRILFKTGQEMKIFQFSNLFVSRGPFTAECSKF